MCCDWLTKDEEKERLSIAELCLALYKEDLTNEERASLIGGTAWVGQNVLRNSKWSTVTTM